MELIKHVVDKGFSVLYVDCDVLIFKNPFPYFTKYPGYSILAQRDVELCAGFMYLRPFNNTIRFLNLVVRNIYSTGRTDQDVIIDLLPTFSIKYALLPSSRFASGEVFFNKYQYYWDRRKDELYIFHNNYVVGKQYKELRMREMHMYLMDVDGEYSDPTRKYLTFEVANSEMLETILKTMVRLANALNRTLVLPPTRCNNPEIRRVWCNMCSMQSIYCYNSVLEGAKNGFRESVFFTNANVPAALKYEESHNPIHRFDSQCIPNSRFTSTFPAKRDNHNSFMCHSCNHYRYHCLSQFGFTQNVRVLKYYSV